MGKRSISEDWNELGVHQEDVFTKGEGKRGEAVEESGGFIF